MNEELDPNPFYSIPRIIFAGDYVLKRGWTLATRKLKEFELVYFPKGTETVYHLNSISYKLNKSAFIITRPEEEHSYTFDPTKPTRHLYVHFYWDSMINSDKCLRILSSRIQPLIPITDMTFSTTLFKQILYMASQKPYRWEERCNFMLSSILLELEGLVTEQSQASQLSALPSPIVHALNYINHPQLTDIPSIEKIARLVGWSHAYLTRQFVKYMGITPQQTIMNRRISKACQLLLQEDWSIKEISKVVGISDEHYFSRCFAKIKGITATIYREKYVNSMLKNIEPVLDYENPYPINNAYDFNYNEKNECCEKHNF